MATDCLTGLWNRTHFERMIESELDRSRRYRQPVSLILFDIDYFKSVNDRHGHQAGDAVLRELALVAQTAMRSSDELCRWGGEEFAVIAASTGHPRRFSGCKPNWKKLPSRWERKPSISSGPG